MVYVLIFREWGIGNYNIKISVALLQEVRAEQFEVVKFCEERLVNIHQFIAENIHSRKLTVNSPYDSSTSGTWFQNNILVFYLCKFYQPIR